MTMDKELMEKLEEIYYDLGYIEGMMDARGQDVTADMIRRIVEKVKDAMRYGDEE